MGVFRTMGIHNLTRGLAVDTRLYDLDLISRSLVCPYRRLFFFNVRFLFTVV